MLWINGTQLNDSVRLLRARAYIDLSIMKISSRCSLVSDCKKRRISVTFASMWVEIGTNCSVGYSTTHVNGVFAHALQTCRNRVVVKRLLGKGQVQNLGQNIKGCGTWRYRIPQRQSDGLTPKAFKKASILLSTLSRMKILTIFHLTGSFWLRVVCSKGV